MEKIRITDLKRHRDNEPVKISESMENLFEKITNQNFVPVVDDKGVFIGHKKRCVVIPGKEA